MVIYLVELLLMLLMMTRITLSSKFLKYEHQLGGFDQDLAKQHSVDKSEFRVEGLPKFRRRDCHSQQPKRRLAEKNLNHQEQRRSISPNQQVIQKKIDLNILRGIVRRLPKRLIKSLLKKKYNSTNEFSTSTNFWSKDKEAVVTEYFEISSKLPLKINRIRQRKKPAGPNSILLSKDDDPYSATGVTKESAFDDPSMNYHNILIDPKCVVLKNTKLGPKYFLISGCMEARSASPDVKGVDFNRITIISEWIAGVDPRQLSGPVNILNPAGLAEKSNILLEESTAKLCSGETCNFINGNPNQTSSKINHQVLHKLYIKPHPSASISSFKIDKSKFYKPYRKKGPKNEMKKLRKMIKTKDVVKQSNIKQKLNKWMNKFVHTLGKYCNLDLNKKLQVVDVKQDDNEKNEYVNQQVEKSTGKKHGTSISQVWSSESLSTLDHSLHPNRMKRSWDLEIRYLGDYGEFHRPRMSKKLTSQKKRNDFSTYAEDYFDYVPVFKDEDDNGPDIIMRQFNISGRQRSKFSATFPNKNVTTWKTQLQQVGKLKNVKSLILGAVPILLFLAAILTYRCWPRMTFWWDVRRSRTAAGSSYVEGGGDSERQSLDKKEDVLDFDDSFFRKEVRATWLDRVDLSMRNDQAAEINYNQY